MPITQYITETLHPIAAQNLSKSHNIVYLTCVLIQSQTNYLSKTNLYLKYTVSGYAEIQKETQILSCLFFNLISPLARFNQKLANLWNGSIAHKQ